MRNIDARLFTRYLTLLWVAASMLPAYGQSLDTAFQCRVNYGALYRVEKAWPLVDGSVLCYQQGPNFFSGKKTGSFFKIKPNGDLDSSYYAPVFNFYCVFGFCTCYDYPENLRCDSVGNVMLLAGDNVYINGEATSKINFRLSSTGILDTSLMQYGFSQYASVGPFLNDGRIVSLSPDTLRIFDKSTLEPDTHFHLSSVPAYLAWNLSGCKSINYLGFWRSDTTFYLPIVAGANSASEAITPSKIKGRYPEPIEADKFGRIYECYWNIDTIGGKIYHRILRRTISGGLDTHYAVRVPRSRLAPPYVYNQIEIFVDSLGRIWQYLGGGKYYPEIENYDWYVFNHWELSGGRYRRYDADSGSTSDTIYIVPGTIELRHHNEMITLGPDPENHRWTFTRDAGGGMQPTIRQTEFGANGPITKVLSDAEGRAVILGDFTHFDALKSSRIARVKTNGRVDSTFQCKAFGGKHVGENVAFATWRNDPAQGVLLVNSKPFGSLHRYLYHILPDGKIDSTYAASFPDLPGDTIFDVLRAVQTAGGSVFITLRLRV